MSFFKDKQNVHKNIGSVATLPLDISSDIYDLKIKELELENSVLLRELSNAPSQKENYLEQLMLKNKMLKQKLERK
jgi:hypothetical protein